MRTTVAPDVSVAERPTGHRGTGRGWGRGSGGLDPSLVGLVAEVVEARLAERLTLNDLAAVVTLSPFHFARAFKASTGLAPHQYVTSRRIERAKNLLRRTNVSVAEVAYAVGFSNLSHFRRTFCRHTGFMPADLHADRHA